MQLHRWPRSTLPITRTMQISAVTLPLSPIQPKSREQKEKKGRCSRNFWINARARPARQHIMESYIAAAAAWRLSQAPRQLTHAHTCGALKKRNIGKVRGGAGRDMYSWSTRENVSPRERGCRGLNRDASIYTCARESGEKRRHVWTFR